MGNVGLSDERVIQAAVVVKVFVSATTTILEPRGPREVHEIDEAQIRLE
jgi:hypothetical protein